MVVVSTLSPPYSPDLIHCDIFVPREESGFERQALILYFAEIQRESLSALDSIYVEDFRQCLQQ